MRQARCASGSVLVAAATKEVGGDLQALLRQQGFTVCAGVLSLAEAGRQIISRQPDIALVDAALLPAAGDPAVALDAFLASDLPMVLVLDRQKETIKNRQIPAGAAIVGTLSQPVDPDELAMLVTLALARHQVGRRVLLAKREWERAVDSIHDQIFISDDNFTIVRANRALADSLQLPYDQLLGRKCYALLHGTAEPPASCLHLSMGEEEHFSCCEAEVPRLGGYFQIACYRANGPEGKNGGYIHVLRNITAQKKAEEKLKRDLGCLQGVIDGLADGVMVISPEFRVIMANRAAKRLAPDGLGSRFCYELSHGKHGPCDGSDHSCPLEEVRRTGHAVTVVHRHVHKTAGVYPVEITATPLFDAQGEFAGIIEAARDISERTRLEEEKEVLARRLFEQQKKDAVCRLTGGIAHQFNNLLMRIVGNAELLRMKVQDMPEIQRHAGQLLESAGLMAELTRKMMLYAAADNAFLPEKLALNACIDNVLALTWHERSQNIQVVTELAPDLPLALADEKQISQLLVALLTNADEAMAEAGGKLVVRTRKVLKRRSWRCRHGFTMAAGPYVELAVSDSGHGIAGRDLPHIFDPFFTTRFLGRGLGLAMVESIARRHDGCVFVTTEEGRGTTFNVFLPAAPADEKPVPPEVAAPVGQAATTLKRLLMVDDEPEYLKIVSSYLAGRGFEVRTVTRGEAALKLVAEKPEFFDLVLLDIQLADISGREVYRRLKKMRSGLPVLVISGFDRQTALSGVQFGEGDLFLQKPFGLEALLAAIGGCGGGPRVGGK